MSYNYGNLKHTEIMVIFIMGWIEPMKCQKVFSNTLILEKFNRTIF